MCPDVHVRREGVTVTSGPSAPSATGVEYGHELNGDGEGRVEDFTNGGFKKCAEPEWTSFA